MQNSEEQASSNQEREEEDEENMIDIVGAVKLMDGIFLGDAICSEVRLKQTYLFKGHRVLEVQ